MFKYVAFVAFLTVVSATAVQECPGKTPPLEVRIEGCEELPCDFVKGTNIVVEADGFVDHLITAATIKATARWNGIDIEVPLEQPDACQLLVDNTCPVEGGQVVSLRAEIEVPAMLPEAYITLTVEIVDQDDAVVVCFMGEGTIISP